MLGPVTIDDAVSSSPCGRWDRPSALLQFQLVTVVLDLGVSGGEPEKRENLAPPLAIYACAVARGFGRTTQEQASGRPVDLAWSSVASSFPLVAVPWTEFNTARSLVS